MEISRPDVSSTEIIIRPEAERFIKVPIGKYLELVNVDPIPPQMALINAIEDPRYRFITAVLSRRTGKSYISNIIGHLVTLVPGSQILIMAPNYSLSQISWDLQRKFLNQFDVELEKCNAKDKIIELKNGSTIRMGSVSQADSVVGRSYDLIIFDEAALNDEGKNVFEVQLLPTLDKPQSKAIFISTPRGKNWFYEFYMRGFNDEFIEWCSIRSTWKDNPRANERNIEEARRGTSKANFAQEYECDFISLEGQIYNINKGNICDLDLTTITKIDVLSGLDLGFKDPTALIVIISDGFNFYVVDEYLKNEQATSAYAEAIQGFITKWGIDFIYIDSAAAQTKYDLAYDYEIDTVNAKKSILDGIGYVSSIIDNDRLFVDSSCKHTIACLDNYRWDDRAGLMNERAKHDIHSHMADALRYALYSHSFNMENLGQDYWPEK